MSHEPTIAVLQPADLFPAPPRDLAEPIVAVRTDVDPADDPEAAAPFIGPRLEEILGYRAAVRRRHFLAGRVALLEAGRLSLGAELEALEVVLLDSGAPRLRYRGVLHAVSLTHSGELALACVAAAGTRVGLDFEVGAGRRLHLARRVCGPAERTRFRLEDEGDDRRGERFEKIWCLKEALLKAWDVGLVAELQHFAVTEIDSMGRARFESLAPLHPTIPHPLPDSLQAAVGQVEGYPLAAVVIEDGPIPTGAS